MKTNVGSLGRYFPIMTIVFMDNQAHITNMDIKNEPKATIKIKVTRKDGTEEPEFEVPAVIVKGE